MLGAFHFKIESNSLSPMREEREDVENEREKTLALNDAVLYYSFELEIILERSSLSSKSIR